MSTHLLPFQVLAQGYSVGRVEEMPQAEGGSSSNKLLVRQLVRIYTPGTAVEGLLLDDQVIRTGGRSEHWERQQGCTLGAGSGTTPKESYPRAA